MLQLTGGQQDLKSDAYGLCTTVKESVVPNLQHHPRAEDDQHSYELPILEETCRTSVSSVFHGLAYNIRQI